MGVLMENAKYICPRCFAEYVSKLQCDHCGDLFCDLCETRKIINALASTLKVQFFCPSCDKSATRIPIATQL